MHCMTDFARGHAGMAGFGDTAALDRSAGDKSRDILRCDSFSHYACGRQFTYWMQRGRLPPGALLAGRREHRLGDRRSRHRALDLQSPGCTRPSTSPTSSAPIARSASGCGSATSKATAAPTSGPRTSAPTADASTSHLAPAWSSVEAARRIAVVPEAFYVPDGDGFVATELTRGPWDPGAQHAGPPSGLLGREIEQLEDAAEFHVGRITFEILRSVPIGPVRVEAEVVRPGRRVQLVEASLSGEDGVLIRARGWRIRTTPIDLPEPIEFPAPPPGPEQGSQPEFFATGQDVGYHTAMEWKSVSGSFLEPGPATVWMRMRGQPGRGRGADAPAADAGRRRCRQRDQRRARLEALPVHQRRPQRPSGAGPGGRVGLRRRGHPAAAERGRPPPSRSFPTGAAGSAAPPRPC